MGTVVTLPPPRRRRSAAAPNRSMATILLFMGVRYVREIEALAPDEVAPATAPERPIDCPPLETA
jgi:hypothetical protein